jgi:hypothetical protein
VQRFYETPIPLKAGRDLISERFTSRLLGWLKFLSPFEFIPRSPEDGISASLQQAAGNSNLKKLNTHLAPDGQEKIVAGFKECTGHGVSLLVKGYCEMKQKSKLRKHQLTALFFGFR